jgi:predicted component of type VI protein secretion system
LAALYYGGLLAQRPRCALNLQALLHDYFQLPVEVLQFQGQWLQLDVASQTRIGGNLTVSQERQRLEAANNQLGVNCVLGAWAP